jgi:hypothetical protein
MSSLYGIEMYDVHMKLLCTFVHFKFGLPNAHSMMKHHIVGQVG